jgi:hypothetical protein
MPDFVYATSKNICIIRFVYGLKFSVDICIWISQFIIVGNYTNSGRTDCNWTWWTHWGNCWLPGFFQENFGWIHHSYDHQIDYLLFQIKLESKGGAHSSLMFCTTGVLLRKLVNADPEDVINSLNATHIIMVRFLSMLDFCTFDDIECLQE